MDAEKRALKKQLRMIEKYERSAKTETRSKRSIGTKVPPKYRCPETGETWSGRGKQPRWLAAAIKDGKEPDDFLISRGQLLAFRKRQRRKLES